jgi:hypothetical protein
MYRLPDITDITRIIIDSVPWRRNMAATSLTELLWGSLNIQSAGVTLRVPSHPARVRHAVYCAGDKIVKNEMGGACSADRGGEGRVQDFVGEN